MFTDPAGRQALQARALLASLCIAAKADWSFEHAGPALSTPFAGYLHVDAAQLLLVPTTSGLPFARRLADRATREARSDALIVSCIPVPRGNPVILLALGLWSLDGTVWQVPVWPWLGHDGTLWLGHASRKLPSQAWALRKARLRAEPAPWQTPREHDGGRARALGWLDKVLE